MPTIMKAASTTTAPRRDRLRCLLLRIINSALEMNTVTLSQGSPDIVLVTMHGADRTVRQDFSVAQIEAELLEGEPVDAIGRVADSRILHSRCLGRTD